MNNIKRYKRFMNESTNQTELTKSIDNFVDISVDTLKSLQEIFTNELNSAINSLDLKNKRSVDKLNSVVEKFDKVKERFDKITDIVDEFDSYININVLPLITDTNEILTDIKYEDITEEQGRVMIKKAQKKYTNNEDIERIKKKIKIL